MFKEYDICIIFRNNSSLKNSRHIVKDRLCVGFHDMTIRTQMGKWNEKYESIFGYTLMASILCSPSFVEKSFRITKK